MANDLAKSELSHYTMSALPLETTLISPVFRVSPCANIEALSSSSALRYTLSHSRTESFKHMLRATVGAERLNSPLIPQLSARRNLHEHKAPSSLVPILTSDLLSRPRSRSISALHMKSPLPSDRDYKRMINRLDKIIHGSALSFKCMTLSESKPADLTLDENEWQYLKVKLQGLQIPLKVSLHRAKGRLICYVSRTISEPTDFFYDEVHSTDDFLISEPGLRFKSSWLYIGIQCLEEATFTVAIKFGYVHRTKKRQVGCRPSAFEDLEELRRDEDKRKELELKVKEALERRKERWKGSEMNFVRRNKGEEVLVEREQWREAQVQRRIETFERKRAHLHSRKARAIANIQKQELRRQAEATARLVLQAKLQHERFQRQWLSLSSFLRASSYLHANWLKAKQAKEDISRKMSAVHIIQRCYRRVRLFVNPKRKIKELLLHHLMLHKGMFGEVVRAEGKEMILAAIKNGVKSNGVRTQVLAWYQKSKFYIVVKLQRRWRRYRIVRVQRMQALSMLWNEAMGVIQAAHPPEGKKSGRKAKGNEQKYALLNRNAVLEAYIADCKRRYFTVIQSYLQSVKELQRSTIFTTAQEPTLNFPNFQYLCSVEEMIAVINTAAGIE